MFGPAGNVLFFVLLVPYIESANRLNEYISHYEGAVYSVEDTRAAHQRAKRSAGAASTSAGSNYYEDNGGGSDTEPTVQLSFRAHGRSFRLRLKRDTDTFSHRLQVVDSSSRPIPHDTSHIYRGHLLGEPGSLVFGAIHDGHFEGKIVTPRESYYVEKASRYFPQSVNTSYHSVIYRESDVEDPYVHRRASGHVGGCGITEEVSQWMETIQNSAVPTADDDS